jgi:hypothetical protein
MTDCGMGANIMEACHMMGKRLTFYIILNSLQMRGPYYNTTKKLHSLNTLSKYTAMEEVVNGEQTE